MNRQLKKKINKNLEKEEKLLLQRRDFITKALIDVDKVLQRKRQTFLKNNNVTKIEEDIDKLEKVSFKLFLPASSSMFCTR
jgi:hypothetical protein